VCVSSSPCRALRSGKGIWKLRKQLRQPHRSSRRATDHDNSSSTVDSSPGVAEKRILGVFSFRTFDWTMSSSIAFGGRTVGVASGSAGPPHP
jgi:hypothetical protein